MRDGTVIGSYRLRERIGAGGMGEVWAGEHALLGRRAAVKLLKPALASEPDVVQRFFNEARAAAAIDDPGIVQIFDFGYHDGAAYIVMELLDGETLEARRRRRTMSCDEALRVIRQVASSLGAAHKRGIVHRDVKPDNIFLVRDPEVPGGERAKILDFGIAKLLGDRNVHTQTSVVMGTPEFMAPEQCRGASRVDERADVYALGCVLFATIAGRAPFHAAGSGEIIAMHLREPAPALSELASVSRDVDIIVARCLEKDPAKRYANGLELAAAVGAVLSHAERSLALFAQLAVAPTLPPPPVGSVAPTTLSGSAVSLPAPRRGPSGVVIAGGVAVVAAAAIVVAIAPWSHGDAAPSAAAAATNIVEPAASPSPKPVAKTASPAPDPATRVAPSIALALDAFTRWSAQHAGARCPTASDLAIEPHELDDPWGHPIAITCTDQPADQIIGAISAGPDGERGTDDDIASWTLGRDITARVRGPRWKPVAAAHVAPPRPRVVPAQAKRAATPPPGAASPTDDDTDNDGIPRKRR
jgi:tRNA A-37 threonylcarbamoyl transferase component Bud32